MQDQLDTLKHKIVEIDDSSLCEQFQQLHIEIRGKHNKEIVSPLSNIKETVSSYVDKMEEPDLESMKNPMDHLTGMFSSFFGCNMSNNPLSGFMDQVKSSMTQFEVKSEDILSWRSHPVLIKILDLDPQARYMYLAPTAFLPSLSGLYLEFKFQDQPRYVLFLSLNSQPLIYSEHILTPDFLNKVFEVESKKMDPMVRTMMKSQITQFLNLENYWKFLDAKLDPTPPSLSRRRPIYIED